MPPRNRCHTASDFDLRTGPTVFHSACSCLSCDAAVSHSVESASASARLAQRFLPREVRGPVVLALLQVFLPPREEPIARGAEPLPDGLLVAAA